MHNSWELAWCWCPYHKEPAFKPDVVKSYERIEERLVVAVRVAMSWLLLEQSENGDFYVSSGTSMEQELR